MQPGLCRSQRGRAETGPVDAAGTKPLAKHVGNDDLLPQPSAPGLGLPVGRETLLPVMEGLEIGIATRDVTDRIAAGRLDLEDGGARIGEDAGAIGAGKQPREIEHPNAVQQHCLLFCELMSNAEVAALLNRIADLLEIKGENFFKVRAYREAVRQLAKLHPEVEHLRHDGKPPASPACGPSH